jgi:GAF domain-containing protein
MRDWLAARWSGLQDNIIFYAIAAAGGLVLLAWREPWWQRALLLVVVFVIGALAGWLSRRPALRRAVERGVRLGSYARHVADTLANVQMKLAGQHSSSWDRVIDDGILNPAHIWLTEIAGKPAPRIAVLCPNEANTHFVMRHGAGYSMNAKENFSLPFVGSIAAEVMRDGKPIYVPDVDADSRFTPHPKADPSRAYRTMFLVPIKRGIETVAVLSVTATSSDAFPSTERSYLELLASVINVVWGLGQETESESG